MKHYNFDKFLANTLNLAKHLAIQYVDLDRIIQESLYYKVNLSEDKIEAIKKDLSELHFYPSIKNANIFVYQPE